MNLGGLDFDAPSTPKVLSQNLKSESKRYQSVQYSTTKIQNKIWNQQNHLKTARRKATEIRSAA
jgi:hypothetical protein